MKHQFFVSGLVALAVSQGTPQNPGTNEKEATTSSNTSSNTPSTTPSAPKSAYDICMENALTKTNIVAEQAKCSNVPNPTPEQVEKTNECFKKCIEENTDGKTVSECQLTCIPGFLEHNTSDSSVDFSTSTSNNSTNSTSSSKPDNTSSSSSDSSSHAFSYFTLITGLAIVSTL